MEGPEGSGWEERREEKREREEERKKRKRAKRADDLRRSGSIRNAEVTIPYMDTTLWRAVPDSRDHTETASLWIPRLFGHLKVERISAASNWPMAPRQSLGPAASSQPRFKMGTDG